MTENNRQDNKQNYPHSFPRPNPSCFVQYYAPLEPLILLANNFSTTPESLEKVAVAIEDHLKSRNDIAFSSSGSSWSGSILRISSHCAFRVCVYRSRKVENLYIIEGQRVEGDGFLFGALYQELKAKIGGKNSRNVDDNDSQNIEQHSNEDETAAVAILSTDETATVAILSTDNTNDKSPEDEQKEINDLRIHAQNVKRMITSEDINVTLIGIQFAGEMCADEEMSKLMFSFDLVHDLVNVLSQIGTSCVGEMKWHCLHTLFDLCYLANNYTDDFNTYLNNTVVGQHTLFARLQVELDRIYQEIDKSKCSTATKTHMTKNIYSIREKLTCKSDVNSTNI